MTSLQTAQVLRQAGVSTIPVKTDKRPLLPWKVYQTRVPTEEEVAKWFARDAGIALCAGKIQCLDFDEKYSRGIFPRFAARAEEVGLDYMLGELIRQKTPSGGFHLVWRCEGQMIGNLKLASRPATEVERQAGHREFSMIETRGDGGYFLISPSAGYSLESGDWSSIPVISEEDRDALLSLARSFDERTPVEAGGATPAHDEFTAEVAPSSELTPGDDYDQRADIPALLRQHGWKSGAGKYWTRPGKAKGISASWGVVPDRLFVFSSSTEFQPNHVYRPWHIYAVLECGGDFARAAGELRRQGFGGTKKKTLAQALAKYDSPEPSGIEPTPDDPPGVEGIDPRGEAPTNETEDDKIRRLLRARAFDPTRVPPPIRPIYTLGGVVICTPGNITAITAQAKVGKSALVSALTAAAMTDPESDADCLSAVGYNATAKALLYIDTEQAPDDFWHAVNRARRRAKIEQMPDWLHAYTVADLPAQIARKAIAIAMADFSEMHGGIHSVIIDGVADLVLDVNDAEECNTLVAELHGQAIRYDCAIICVIHKNPGTEKVRGHLGSQIERKAETNLALDKEDLVTVVWSAKQRRAPIDRKQGPRFHWDDELKMHVSTAPQVGGATGKVLELLELAESVMKPGESMAWKDLVAALQEARRTPSGVPSSKTAQRWITAMKTAEIITFSFGNYQLKNHSVLAA